MTVFVFIVSILLVWLVPLQSCKSKDAQKYPASPDLYAKVPYLHEHTGTEHYEIINVNRSRIEYDVRNKVFLIRADGGPFYKMDCHGQIIDSIGVLFNDEGINFYPEDHGGADYYSNWVKTGDTTVHEYIDVFPEEDKKSIQYRDSLKYLNKSIELYKQADQVHYYYYYYYYYIDGKWHRIKPSKGGLYIINNYPEKRIPDSRISGTKTMDSIFHEGQWHVLLHPIGMEREYFSTASHRVQTGGVKGSFTSGYWLLKIPLPGDTLVFKRKYDQMGPGLDFTKAPGRYGGTDSVLFIEERTPTTPKEMTEEEIKVFKQQHGGTYLIRPRRK